MNCKKLLALMLVMVFALSMSVFATEEGENEFFLNWSSSDELPLTLWEAKVLPDFNENGRSELFLAADGDDGGAVYYVVEATANDQWEVLWEYYVEDCTYSYTMNNTTEGADLDMDGLPELLLGVPVDAGSGLPGLYIFELDTTFAKDENGSYITYPFPADFPTSVFDVNGNSGAPTVVFTGQLDTDPELELVVGETHEDIIWVFEETGGDLEFPIFEVEYADTIESGTSPWGYYKGDLDNDGQTDWGIGTSYNNSIRLFENVAGEEDAYDRVAEIYVDDDVDGYTNRGLAVVDINNDNLGELIYVRYTAPGKVYAVANPGEIAMIDSSYIGVIFEDPDAGRLVGAAIGDYDHGFGSDGKDIYFASRDGQTVYDLEYVGETGEGIDPATAVDAANYEAYALYTTDQRMQDIEVADFDRDGEGEVAIIYAGSADASKLEVIEHGTLPDAGFEIMWHDVADTTHLIDPVHGNPRGIFAGSDVDQDGKKEIIATEYNGKFHVYEVVSDNVVEWVWSYEFGTGTDSETGAPANGSQPRQVRVADVDNNGLEEIICHMGGTAAAIEASPDSIGWYFFEWDGMTDNGFGFEGGPTYILPVGEVDARLTNSERTESFTVGDVDSDGYTEIIWPCDGGGTGGDGFFIFSCVDGELTGFPTWNTELALHRGSGEMGGSPKYAITADINGNGMGEAIFASWNNGQMNIFEAIAPDTYEATEIFTDITLTDETIYKGFGAFDIDGNGDDELIFNSYWNATIYLIDSPENIADIDVNNPEHYSWLREDAGGSGLTGALGDQDSDGLPEFYVTLYTRGGVRSLEYNGVGDYMDGDNWTMQEVYVDRDYVYAPDVNPVTAVHGSFAIEAPVEDLDGDGKKEVVVSMIESPISDTWLYIFESTNSSSVNDAWRVINPSDYKLSQNYPNPFNPETTINYTLPLQKDVSIKIYNSMGQLVKTLVDNENKAAGTHSVIWDATDNMNRSVASGQYIYRLQVGNVKQSMSMTLLK